MWFNTKARQEIIDVSDAVAEQVRESGVREGFVLVSAMRITASVFVNDHESGLWQDILEWLERTVAPWDPSRYRHNQTGEDNAAAHLRSLTIGHEVLVPITEGKLDLGPLAAGVLRRVGRPAQEACDHQGVGGLDISRKLFIFNAITELEGGTGGVGSSSGAQRPRWKAEESAPARCGERGDPPACRSSHN